MAIHEDRFFNGADWPGRLAGSGPDGGSDEKQVGTVWIAVAGHSGVTSKKYIFKHNRERNIIRTTHTALNMLRIFIINENQKTS